MDVSENRSGISCTSGIATWKYTSVHVCECLIIIQTHSLYTDSSYVFTQSLGRAAFYETNSNCWKSCDSRAFFASSNITRIQWVAAFLWELATGLPRQMCFNKALTCTTGKKLTDTTSEVYVAVYGAGEKGNESDNMAHSAFIGCNDWLTSVKPHIWLCLRRHWHQMLESLDSQNISEENGETPVVAKASVG